MSVVCAVVASCHGGGDGAGGSDATVVTGCVTNGAAETSYLRLDASEENAIVRVDVSAADGNGGDSAAAGATCTGVLVVPGWVLTARHCAPSAGAAATALVSFGADARSGTGGAVPCAGSSVAAGTPAPGSTVRAPGTRLVPHPELDLMLIALDAPWPIDGLSATPIAIGGDQQLAVGALAQLGGVGRTESGGGAGLRRFLVEEIVALDDRFITVDGRGRSGLCASDSGGPLLVRGDGGRALVAGILNSGSSDCLGQDAFTRLAGAADWIATQLAGREGPAPANPAPCDRLGEQGRCFGSLAAWCDGGLLRGERCGETTACGWSPGAAGFRCLAASDDPCGGVSDTGRCTSEDAVRCDAGHLVVSSCSECIRSPRTGVVTCAASD